MSSTLRLFFGIVLFIWFDLTSASTLVKRDSGPSSSSSSQLINSLTGAGPTGGNDGGHFMNKRPFCNAFTGCGKKRSISIPTYPSLPPSFISSSSLLDDQSSSSSSSSAPFLTTLPLSSSPTSTTITSEEVVTTNEWLNYLRLTQRMIEEARSWEILQNRVNQFGPIEIGHQRSFGFSE